MREQEDFKYQMKGEGKRLQDSSREQIVFAFFRTQRMLAEVQKMMKQVSNLKFDVHLKNFGSDFERALSRIKSFSDEE